MNHDDELRLKTDRKLSAGYILKRNLKILYTRIRSVMVRIIKKILRMK